MREYIVFLAPCSTGCHDGEVIGRVTATSYLTALWQAHTLYTFNADVYRVPQIH